jgi:SAM-dependent methyltransferase
MARAAGPEGSALGGDTDEGALEIARRRAGEAGIAATFARGEAAVPPRRNTFDLAFARLLLSHLADPMSAIRAMRDAVRPGGTLAVEDLDASTLRSVPPDPALERLARVYSATVRAHGGDPTIGPRLPAMLAAAGLESVDATVVVNPMRGAAEKVFLVELVDNMREAILAAEAASAGELDDLRTAVAAAARDPRTVVCQAAMHQVWGTRPEAPSC